MSVPPFKFANNITLQYVFYHAKLSPITNLGVLFFLYNSEINHEKISFIFSVLGVLSLRGSRVDPSRRFAPHESDLKKCWKYFLGIRMSIE